MSHLSIVKNIHCTVQRCFKFDISISKLKQDRSNFNSKDHPIKSKVAPNIATKISPKILKSQHKNCWGLRGPQVLLYLMPGPWSVFQSVDNFGNRFYWKEKSTAWPLLFSIESVTKVVNRLKRTTWIRHKCLLELNPFPILRSLPYNYVAQSAKIPRILTLLFPIIQPSSAWARGDFNVRCSHQKKI